MEKRTPRRTFLKYLIAGTGAGIAIPSTGLALGPSHPSNPLPVADSIGSFPVFPSPRQPESKAEQYWEIIRQQFSIRDGLVMMNAANLCPAPLPVSDRMIEHLRGLNADASSQDRQKYMDIHETTRKLLAEYLRVGTDEIVITRNTSEGNNIIHNGLDLGSGDEVVYWDQNHQSLNIAIEVRAKRAGFTPVKVSTPAQSGSRDELAGAFTNVFNKRTRLVAFSHISNITGMGLPAQQICTEARKKGILSLVDGAQSFGYMDLDLKKMDCDFYTGSSHKWLMGPKEAGVLYARKESAPEVWPLVVSKGWHWENEGTAWNLQQYGQRNDATIAAFGEAVIFHKRIGPENLEKRVRTHTISLKENLLSNIPGIKMITPALDEFNGNIVVFTIDDKDSDELVRALYNRYEIAAAAMHHDFTGIRFSPGIYNNKEELDRTVESLVHLVKHT